MIMVLLQTLDSILGFPTGFDVVADLTEQYLQARQFIYSVKWV